MLNSREILITKVLVDSYNRHDEFVLVNNVWSKYDYVKEKRKNLKSSIAHQSLVYLFIYLYFVWVAKKHTATTWKLQRKIKES